MDERAWEILAERMGTTGEELRILNDNLTQAERERDASEARLAELVEAVKAVLKADAQRQQGQRVSLRPSLDALRAAADRASQQGDK